MRSAILPISRRYRADRMYGIKRLNGKFSTDTLYGICKSLRGYVFSQIYSHKCGFAVPYHMKSTSAENVGTSLGHFIHEYGVPEKLTFDGAAIQVGDNTKFMQYIRKHYINFHVSSPRRPNENPVEGSIREIKKRAYRIKSKYNVPDSLWDFLITYICETGNICANSSKYSEARTPLEIITGETPDISEYVDFAFYSWVTFRQNAGLGEMELGRWLGVSHRVGMMMPYWILPGSGIPISCVTVQKLTYLAQQTIEWKEHMEDFSRGLEDKFNAKTSTISVSDDPDVQNNIFDINNESPEFIEEYNRVIDNSAVLYAEDELQDEPQMEESYLNMELGIRRNGESDMINATVKRRAVDSDGLPVGQYNDNPLLDSRVYEVEYSDGTSGKMSANIIAENLLSQVDEEGKRQMMIEEIIDHRVNDTAIPIKDGTFTTKNGLIRPKRTTRGWELCVLWKDGSTDWVQLKDLKESYPLEVAEYATLANITHEPAFAWWVKGTLKKRDRMIKRVRSKYWHRTHKYGIRIPKTAKEAKEIDDENRNTLWMDAIKLEIKNIMIAFTEYDGDVNELKGFEEITGHLVFDVKLGENFRRKARYCADGHKTAAPSSLTYSTVVARDSVRIMLLVAALNDISIAGADIQNAFLTAPNREKNFLRAGPEFGESEGTIFIVTRALYGLKSAGASFRAHLAVHLDDMGFKSTHPYPDVWRRPAIKSSGEKYYEYFLTYVDDLLVLSQNPDIVLKEIGRTFKFKNNMIAEPENYLGARLKKKNIAGTDVWTITSLDYLKP